MSTRNEDYGSMGEPMRSKKYVEIPHMTKEIDKEDVFPPDFELPIERHDQKNTDQNEYEKEEEMLFDDGEMSTGEHLTDMPPDQSIGFLLTGAGDPPTNGISLSQEESLVISSTISLYSSYVDYIRETDLELHKRAIAYSSDTVDLHPMVVLTDHEGNPLERFRDPEDGDEDDDGYDDEKDRR
jgi:hypothetical protein